jgi:hypothetical protein
MALFVGSDSKVDREALREYALKKLNQFDTKSQFLLRTRENQNFWSTLHRLIASMPEQEKASYLKIENQLVNLPSFIEGWIRMAVETEQRFSFFVKSKAEEIGTGDEKKDYFWALQIRHDQMIGLLRVLETLLSIIESWVLKNPKEVLNDGIFLGLEVHTIEDQIYLEAEKVKSEREKLLS